MLATRRVADEAEVLIVGAGPAGSTCAALLAERGHDVVLVDQSEFPRDKPCGDGLTRSAVEVLEGLGLGELMERGHPVEGGRLVADHGATMVRTFSPQPGLPDVGRCVPRRDLDQQLLDVATARGARHTIARAEAPLHDDHGKVVGVRCKSGDGVLELRARQVVASDGATSRMRRESFGDGRPSSYAARAYYTVGRPLDPLFDVYLPLRVGATTVEGYGWVFPISELVANVGVAVFGRSAERLPITRVLEAFVEELELREQARFAGLERISRPFGSPLAVRFSSDRCEHGGMLLLGDAAQTVDPLSGEGIAAALRGAGLVADRIGRLARGPAREAREPRHADVLSRRFPRLGDDPWGLYRIGRRAFAGESGPRLGSLRSGNRPFLSSALAAAAKPDEDPSVRLTPVGAVASVLGPSYESALDALGERALDTLRSPLAMLAELVHRELRAHAGPTCGATMLFALLDEGGEVDDGVLDLALAFDLLSIVPRLVAQVTDSARDAAGKANNALALLATDLAHIRGLRAAAAAGPATAGAFGSATRSLCEGQMRLSEQRGQVELSVAELARTVRARSGDCYGWAVRCVLGADVVSRERAALSICKAAELGVAFHIARDVAELLSGDRATGSAAGAEAARGVPSWPVVRAAECSERVRALLRGACEPQELIAATVEAGGLELALSDLRIYAGADAPSPSMHTLGELAVAHAEQAILAVPTTRPAPLAAAS